MPRRNRVDPWGDLHAVSARDLFTGNRACIVDEREQIVRHHRSSTLWITSGGARTQRATNQNQPVPVSPDLQTSSLV